MKKLLSIALFFVLALTLLPSSALADTPVYSGGSAAAFSEPDAPVVSAKLTKCATVSASRISPFTDVSGDDWFCEDVEYAYENGLFKGVTDNAFCPQMSMTRAQLVAVLYRLAGEPTIYFIRQPDPVFSDVAGDEWFAEAVQWAALEGMVNGDGGKFNPNVPITRAQLVTILYRYAEHRDCDVSVGEDTNILSYADALTIPEYAIPAFQWTCGAGILQGNEENLFPFQNATRAQVAAMIHRFCESIGK